MFSKILALFALVAAAFLVEQTTACGFGGGFGGYGGWGGYGGYGLTTYSPIMYTTPVVYGSYYPTYGLGYGYGRGWGLGRGWGFGRGWGRFF